MECVRDCDVVLQLCEMITLVKSIQNRSLLLFLMTVNLQLSQKRTSLFKKKKKRNASALVMG